MTKDDFQVFTGFDTRGEVSFGSEGVVRRIYGPHAETTRRILDICVGVDIFGSGLVRTRIAREPSGQAEIQDLYLEHERVPFISYPHEWPSLLLRDAALHHIDLSLTLAPQGIIIKDFHPWNILFRATEPIFVDFAALVFPDALAGEKWLQEAGPGPGVPWSFLYDDYTRLFHHLYSLMFHPYFGVPLRGYAGGQFAATRRYLRGNIMNAPADPGAPPPRRRNPLCRVEEALGREKLKAALRGGDRYKVSFLKALRRWVASLDVTEGSGYGDYYTLKGEDFSFTPSPGWKAKQRIVHSLLKRARPRTVLDVGANTGWYSVLAARMGCGVVAIDTDEGCMNDLVLRAAGENLDVLPLVMDLLDLTPDIFPDPALAEVTTGEGGNARPLLLAAAKRFRCDMVMALAIVHHLALGEGQNFGEICRRLADLAGKTLVLEFVSKDDDLVVENKTHFFQAYHRHPDRFGWYAIDGLVEELKKHFRSVTVHESHPATRKILVCEDAGVSMAR